LNPTTTSGSAGASDLFILPPILCRCINADGDWWFRVQSNEVLAGRYQ
jgi:hypothetical protein